MSRSKTQPAVRSLKELDRLIPKDRLRSSNARKTTSSQRFPSPPAPPENPKDDKDLFLSAMADVQPLDGPSRKAKPPPLLGNTPPGTAPDAEGLEALTALVREGKNFRVEYTSEYIEGRGYRVPPEITRRLHQGRFAIQDHLDLHGHTAAGAEEALVKFFKKALETGKHAVLIVHGRGRSSPVKPILKGLVQHWLKQGPYRKHMVAYASARPCDGGTGATYVLLRRQPFTKRHRKKKKTKSDLV